MNAVCACGIFAIGQCAECDKYVCGLHGSLLDNRLTCTDDIRLRRTEVAEAKERADKEAADQAEKDWADMVAAKVGRGNDAIDRWLRARTSPLAAEYKVISEIARRALIDRIRTLVMDAPGSGEVNVDGSEVSDWSADAVDVVSWLQSRRSPDAMVSVGFLRTIDGWCIGSGAWEGASKDWNYDVILRTDGRVTKVSAGTSKANRYQLSISEYFGTEDDFIHLAAYLGLK